MSTAGKKLLSSLVHTGDLQAYIKMGLQPHLFRESEEDLFKVIEAHVKKYGKIPSQITIEDLPGMEDAIVPAPEPAQFYLDEVEHRFLHTSLKKTIQEASLLLSDKHSTAALDVLLKLTAQVHAQTQRNHLYDFRHAEKLIHEAYLAQKTMGNEVALPYGWQTLDEMSGGMRPGDFVSYVGRPMAGKTFKILYTSMNSWRIGRAPLLVTLEMNPTILQQRLIAIHAKKKLTDLMKAELSTKAFKGLMQTLTDMHDFDTPFWILDGDMGGTVDDIAMQCHMLNPSCVFVDGAYLLEHPDRKMGKWDKQSENARLLKKVIANGMGLPVIASYQLSKGSAKAKKVSKSVVADGMEDVHGSDEMAQLSTVMLGLFDDENSIEAKKTRKVKILKGRNGETGEFRINWDFSNKMDFSEHVEEKAEDIQMDFMG